MKVIVNVCVSNEYLSNWFRIWAHKQCWALLVCPYHTVLALPPSFFPGTIKNDGYQLKKPCMVWGKIICQTISPWGFLTPRILAFNYCYVVGFRKHVFSIDTFQCLWKRYVSLFCEIHFPWWSSEPPLS